MTTELRGEAQQVLAPDEFNDYALGKPLQAVADGCHVVVVDDTDHYDNSLKTRILSTLLLRHVDPPPTLVISDPPFDEGDEIRVRAEQTHLEKVFADCDAVEVLS